MAEPGGMRRIGPLVHSAADWVLALAMLFSPELFGVEGTAVPIARISGAAYLVASLLTNDPLGIARGVPFPAMRPLKILAALFWAAAPALFGFAGHAASTTVFVAMAAIVATIALSDYHSTHTYLRERRDAGRDRRTKHVRLSAERRLGPVDRRIGRYYPAARDPDVF